MKIQLLKDTYIRKSPAILPGNILGVARRGECLLVEEEAVEGHAFRAISRWYRDFQGRYLWAGATAVRKETDWAYDPLRMNTLIQEWGVAERFWHREIRGEGVNIAILSTGIDGRHPDLSPNIKAACNFCNPPDSGNVMDHDGEGTRIAGLIAASGAHQVYGLAPRAGLFIGKVAESSAAYDINRLVDALYWALSLPVDLLCIGAALNPEKLGGLEMAALEQVLQRIADKGCLALAPAAFASSLPASLESCLAVADQDALPDPAPATLQGCSAPGSKLLTVAFHGHAGIAFRNRTIISSRFRRAYFFASRGARREHSCGYATDEQRRMAEKYAAQNEEVIIDRFLNGPKAAAAATCGLLALAGQAARQKKAAFPLVRIWEMARRQALPGNGAPCAYLPADQFFLMDLNLE